MSLITLTVLGSGTGAGVPSIGCDCDVRTSADPRDNRLRPSVWLRFNNRDIVIDTTPGFRYQALRVRIPQARRRPPHPRPRRPHSRTRRIPPLQLRLSGSMRVSGSQARRPQTRYRHHRRLGHGRGSATLTPMLTGKGVAGTILSFGIPEAARAIWIRSPTQNQSPVIVAGPP